MFGSSILNVATFKYSSLKFRETIHGERDREKQIRVVSQKRSATIQTAVYSELFDL